MQLPNLVHTGKKIKSKNGSIKITSYIINKRGCPLCIDTVYMSRSIFLVLFIYSIENVLHFAMAHRVIDGLGLYSSKANLGLIIMNLFFSFAIITQCQ